MVTKKLIFHPCGNLLLGSVVGLSNNSGIIVEGYIYDVFGKCPVITIAGIDGNW
jgi:hypothetical protein